jgi:hypothetical protein
MQWRRGFFRLWCIFSGAWAFGLLLLAITVLPGDEMPAYCQLDAQPAITDAEKLGLVIRDESTGKITEWRAHPDHKAKIYLSAGLESDVCVAKWRKSAQRDAVKIAVLALAVPLLILLAGGVIGWGLAGFKRKTVT